MIREAIAMVLNIDPDSFDVEIHPILDADLGQMVTAAAHARDAAATARANATDALRQLVETASRDGYTVRDIAEIAGVSHQYAAKLTNR
jgi:hypothetical protein